jgi:hypothetical protein
MYGKGEWSMIPPSRGWTWHKTFSQQIRYTCGKTTYKSTTYVVDRIDLHEPQDKVDGLQGHWVLQWRNLKTNTLEFETRVNLWQLLRSVKYGREEWSQVVDIVPMLDEGFLKLHCHSQVWELVPVGPHGPAFVSAEMDKTGISESLLFIKKEDAAQDTHLVHHWISDTKVEEEKAILSWVFVGGVSVQTLHRGRTVNGRNA